MVNNITNIEQAIIGKLKADIQGVQIEAYPDKPAEYKLLHARGALLVRYAGSDFSPPLPTDIVVQNRDVDFDIAVVMRHLTGHDGIYEMLDRVRESLTGYQPIGCSKMYPVSEKFVSEENGIWQYAVSLRTRTQHVQKFKERQKIEFVDGEYAEG